MKRGRERESVGKEVISSREREKHIESRKGGDRRLKMREMREDKSPEQ